MLHRSFQTHQAHSSSLLTIVSRRKAACMTGIGKVTQIFGRAIIAIDYAATRAVMFLGVSQASFRQSSATIQEPGWSRTWLLST